MQLTYFIIDKKGYEKNLDEVGKICQNKLSKHFPSMFMLVVACRVEHDALLENETSIKIK